MYDIYSGSGASTKISLMLGILVGLISKGYFPNLIIGISASSILAPFFATKRLDEITPVILDATLDTIFDKKPVNNKGIPTISAALRVFKGYDYLGEQGNLEGILMSYFTENDLYDYRMSDAPQCYIGATNCDTRECEYFDIKNPEWSYSEVIEIIMASTSIPPYVPPRAIRGSWYYDGGMRDHNGSASVIEKLCPQNTRLVTTYSRPADGGFSGKYVRGNIMKAISWAYETLVTGISLDDEKDTDKLCKNLSIPQVKIFAPYKLTDKAYEITPQLSNEWYQLGLKASIAYNGFV